MSGQVDLATKADKSRWVDLAAGPDKSTTGADKSRQVDLATRADKYRQVDASKWVNCQSTRLDGSTWLRADKSRQVDFAAGNNTSRLVDLAPRSQKV